MKRIDWYATAMTVAFVVYLGSLLALTQCTPGQRGVANSVLDLAEKVCHETDTVPVCLSKCELEQAHQDAERADAGADR